MPTKKPHPADLADRAKILTATHFNVHLRRGPAFKVNEEAPTLAAAMAAADRITLEHGKRPLVYAVTPEGTSVYVPAGVVPKARSGTSETTPAADQPQAIVEKPAKSTRAPGRRRTTGKRAAALEAAHRGELPPAPDFSAPTHARFRDKLATLVAMANARDLDGLRAVTINPVSSSPQAMLKYRDLCVIALDASSSGL